MGQATKSESIQFEVNELCWNSSRQARKPVEWTFWVIFFTGIATFLVIIVLLIRVEHEKAVSMRQFDCPTPSECVCHCAGATTLGRGYGHGAARRLEAEADRWRAVAEEYRDLLVQSGVLRLDGGSEGGQDASVEQVLTIDRKVVGEL